MVSLLLGKPGGGGKWWGRLSASPHALPSSAGALEEVILASRSLRASGVPRPGTPRMLLRELHACSQCACSQMLTALSGRSLHTPPPVVSSSKRGGGLRNVALKHSLRHSPPPFQAWQHALKKHSHERAALERQRRGQESLLGSMAEARVIFEGVQPFFLGTLSPGKLKAFIHPWNWLHFPS